MIGGGDFRTHQGGGEESVVSDQVYLAWQTLGCLEHGLNGGRLEQWQLGASQAREMHQA